MTFSHPQAQMVRKVRSYLSTMPANINEEELAEMSNQCEAPGKNIHLSLCPALVSLLLACILSLLCLRLSAGVLVSSFLSCVCVTVTVCVCVWIGT